MLSFRNQLLLLIQSVSAKPYSFNLQKQKKQGANIPVVDHFDETVMNVLNLHQTDDDDDLVARNMSDFSDL